MPFDLIDLANKSPFVAVTITAAVLVILAIERFVLPRDERGIAPLHRLKARMGAGGMALWLFVAMMLVWLVLFLCLVFGLLVLIYDTFAAGLPTDEDTRAIWRFTLTKLVALTGVLAAVVALPFTAVRLKLAQDQNDHAAEALYNEKMDTAVSDLHAQRQITRWSDDGEPKTGWEDDITRRNGAVDRLLGLTQENPALVPRVDRLLTVYLRELTRELPAKEPPEGATPDELKAWAEGLKRVRSDMENAVQTLSKLSRTTDPVAEQKLPDLQGINLQGFNLSQLMLSNADLSLAQMEGANLRLAQMEGANLFGAQMQGANLWAAQMQGANLWGAQMEGANLRLAQMEGADVRRAQMQGANLWGAQMAGADLSGARLQGADLSGAKFDADTSLTAATLRGAAVREVDFTDVPQIADHLDELFGDASVKLPEGVPRPARFDVTYETGEEFITAWRAFQRAIGQDPDNPE